MNAANEEGRMLRPIRMIRAPLVAGTLAGLLAGCSSGVTDDEVIARSKPIAQKFQSDLQLQLRMALKSGGPTQAVEVCSQVAPAIAKAASEESGAKVSRIALRQRNPGAIIPPELREAYEALAAAPTTGDKPSVRIVRTGTGADARIHFLGAIPMKEQPCSVCHGTKIAPEVAEVLAREYPDDEATGFKPGELRGALDISWPASAFDSPAK